MNEELREAPSAWRVSRQSVAGASCPKSNPSFNVQCSIPLPFAASPSSCEEFQPQMHPKGIADADAHRWKSINLVFVMDSFLQGGAEEKEEDEKLEAGGLQLERT
jgi:hypothetical protein